MTYETDGIPRTQVEREHKAKAMFHALAASIAKSPQEKDIQALLLILDHQVDPVTTKRHNRVRASLRQALYEWHTG